jgi:hypothetical protein
MGSSLLPWVRALSRIVKMGRSAGLVRRFNTKGCWSFTARWRSLQLIPLPALSPGDVPTMDSQAMISRPLQIAYHPFNPAGFRPFSIRTSPRGEGL